MGRRLRSWLLVSETRQRRLGIVLEETKLPRIHLCGPVQKLEPPRQRSIIGLIKGTEVPIGVGSLASCVRTRSARKNMYIAHMPVEITVMTDIMLMLEVAIEN